MKYIIIIAALLAVSSNADKLVNLQIDGMTCPSCIGHVKSTIGSVNGVKETTIYFKEGKAQVKATDTAKSEAMCDAMKKSGYGCKVLK